MRSGLNGETDAGCLLGVLEAFVLSGQPPAVRSKVRRPRAAPGHAAPPQTVAALHQTDRTSARNRGTGTLQFQPAGRSADSPPRRWQALRCMRITLLCSPRLQPAVLAAANAQLAALLPAR